MQLNNIIEKLKTPTAKIIIGIVVVLLLILIIIKRNDAILQDGLTGVWQGAEDFCAESEISGMTVIIGERTGLFSNNRSCYIIISPNMVAQQFNVCHSTPSGSITSTKKLSAKMEFEEEDIMPSNMTWLYNYAEGRLIFESDKTYAVLFKSPELTYVVKHNDSDSDEEDHFIEEPDKPVEANDDQPPIQLETTDAR